MSRWAANGQHKKSFCQLTIAGLKQPLVIGLAVLAMLFSFPLLANNEQDKKHTPDLPYSAALYQFFQQNYFSAITELLVAEKRHQLKNSADFAHLLRGGIHLSYGMENEAEALFEQSLGDNIDQENQARAWFYLGKLLYKKGDFKHAEDKFKYVSSALTQALHPEYAFLKESTSQRLFTLKEQHLGAEIGKQALQNLELEDLELEDLELEGPSLNDHSVKDEWFSPELAKKSIWSFYQRYNQQLSALAYDCKDGCSDDEVIQNKINVASKLIQLANYIGHSELIGNKQELLNLKDKIHTAVGFIYLEVKQPQSAIKQFKQVRKNSLLVGQALLGYGWAAVNAGDYPQALVPWQLLMTRSMQEPSTHEALLAVPFVYEKLGANADALKKYDQASNQLANEITLLKKLQAKLPMLSADMILNLQENNKIAWLDEKPIDIKQNLTELKTDVEQAESKLKNRLIQLQSKQTFSVIRKQFVDVKWLQAQLQLWEFDLEVMRFMVDARQQRSAMVIQPEFKPQLQQRYDELLNQKNKITAQLENFSAAHNTNLAWLMTASEQKQWARIQHAEQKIDAIENARKQLNKQQGKFKLNVLDDKSFAKSKRNLRWAKGVLHWQISQHASDTQWQYNKHLWAINRALEDTKLALNELDTVIVQATEQYQEKQQMLLLAQRVAVQTQQAKQLYSHLTQQLKTVLDKELAQQINQANRYLAQARLAKARLLDTLSLEGEQLNVQPVAEVGS